MVAPPRFVYILKSVIEPDEYYTGVTSDMRQNFLILATVASIGCALHTPDAPVRVTEDQLPAWTRGRGPEVVLVHGAVGDYRVWEPVIRELRSKYRLTAISRRYHWPRLATPAPGAYTFEHHADDLAAVLRQLGANVHVVGHSYGAGVALLTALRYPELVRSLVLIEPPFGSVVPVNENGFAAELARRDSLVGVIRRDVARGLDRRAAEQLIDWVQGRPDGFRRLPARSREQIHDNAPTIGPTYGAASAEVTCDDLRSLRIPVLVVTGRNTRLWYQLIAVHTSNCLPLVERTTIAKAAHMLIVEQPVDTALALTRFLGRH
jgi:pimeloyl-ACP methyl ester carboxylesterase